jgi:hypothetical protein
MCWGIIWRTISRNLRYYVIGEEACALNCADTASLC